MAAVATSSATAACHPQAAKPRPDAVSPASSGSAKGMVQHAAHAAATPNTANTLFMIVLVETGTAPRYTEL